MTMSDDEWDQSGTCDFEGQYRRSYREPLSASAIGGVKNKAKKKAPARVRVEKFIFFLCRHYEVRINKNGLVFQKGGLKSLASARECRDEKLAGFVKKDYTIRGKGSKSSTPACFLK